LLGFSANAQLWREISLFPVKWFSSAELSGIEEVKSYFCHWRKACIQFEHQFKSI